MKADDQFEELRQEVIMLAHLAQSKAVQTAAQRGPNEHALIAGLEQLAQLAQDISKQSDAAAGPPLTQTREKQCNTRFGVLANILRTLDASCELQDSLLSDGRRGIGGTPQRPKSPSSDNRKPRPHLPKPSPRATGLSGPGRTPPQRLKEESELQ